MVLPWRLLQVESLLKPQRSVFIPLDQRAPLVLHPIRSGQRCNRFRNCDSLPIAIALKFHFPPTGSNVKANPLSGEIRCKAIFQILKPKSSGLSGCVVGRLVVPEHTGNLCLRGYRQ